MCLFILFAVNNVRLLSPISEVKDLIDARNFKILLVEDIGAGHIEVGQGEVEAGVGGGVDLAVLVTVVLRGVVPLRDGVWQRFSRPLFRGQLPYVRR